MIVPGIGWGALDGMAGARTGATHYEQGQQDSQEESG